MSALQSIGGLPLGPNRDRLSRVRDRLELWLKVLSPGEEFTYHQARKCINAGWDQTRIELNYFAELGWVEKLERSRWWRRL